jgi:hypothetical protein
VKKESQMDSTFWPFSFLGFFWFWYCFLRPLRCPSCSAELSRVLAPYTKTREQWIEGFVICPHCDTQFYDNGKIRVAPMTQKEIQKLWMPFLLLLVCTMGLTFWYRHKIRTDVVVLPTPAPTTAPAPPQAITTPLN